MNDTLIDLTDRTVMVTGAGQGVGREIALTAARAGATLVVNDFHESRAKEVCDEIAAAGGKAIASSCDVTDFEAVKDSVRAASDEVGTIDILVNNAGNAGPSVNPIGEYVPFWETGPKEWDAWINTNFYGVLHATHAVLPGMVDNKWGRVITIVSDAARVGEPNFVVYGGAKAGAAGFSRSLAKAVGRYNITANCVSLATMNTPGVADALSDPVAVKRLLSGYAIRRLGEPHDAAAMVTFLASDAASWITGQTYPVNGGYSVAM